MEQYIKKSALVLEIEKRIKEINLDSIEDWRYRLQREHDIEVMKNILSLVNTLEVKEEVLDRNDKTKLMQKCVKAAYKRGYDIGVLQTTNKMNSNIKEVDLEKEIENVRKTYFINSDFEKATLEGRQITNIAKHFFELGLKTKKRE